MQRVVHFGVVRLMRAWAKTWAACFMGCLCFCVGTLPSEAGLENAPLSLGSTLRPKKVALVIGINASKRSHYWSPLRYARQDAQRFARSLRRNASFDRIHLLTDPAQTTTQRLREALRRLQAQVKSSEDMVVVYISAHGTVSKGRVRYIITSDTTRNVSKTALSIPQIRNELRKLPSRKIGLVLATCYTGSTRSKAVKVPGFKGGITPSGPMVRERAIQILSAASYAQPAFESSLLKGDIYTHFFLDCFRKLKHKTIIKIHVCAASKTTPFVQKWNGEVQVPKAYSLLGANRDFALLSGTLRPRRMGYFRTQTGKKKGLFFRLFRMGRKSSSSRNYKASSGEYAALLPGRYRVVVQSSEGRMLREDTIVVRSGRVSQLPTNWSLEFQAGTWITSGLFQTNGDVSGLGMAGIRHRYFAFFLGAWGTSVPFDAFSYTQFGLELRLEGGYSHQWGRFSLFGGVYTSLSLLLQDVNQLVQPTPLFHGGATLSLGVWLSPHWGLVLGGDVGLVPHTVNTQFRVTLNGGARLGFRYRFGG